MVSLEHVLNCVLTFVGIYCVYIVLIGVVFGLYVWSRVYQKKKRMGYEPK